MLIIVIILHLQVMKLQFFYFLKRLDSYAESFPVENKENRDSVLMSLSLENMGMSLTVEYICRYEMSPEKDWNLSSFWLEFLEINGKLNKVSD